MARASKLSKRLEKHGRREMIYMKNMWKMMTNSRVIPRYVGEKVNNEFLEDKWDQ
jgi:hypothetical protein